MASRACQKLSVNFSSMHLLLPESCGKELTQASEISCVFLFEAYVIFI